MLLIFYTNLIKVNKADSHASQNGTERACVYCPSICPRPYDNLLDRYSTKTKLNLVTLIEPKPLARPNNTAAHPTRPTNPDSQTPVRQPHLARATLRARLHRARVFELSTRREGRGAVANGLLTQPICLVPTSPTSHFFPFFSPGHPLLHPSVYKCGATAGAAAVGGPYSGILLLSPSHHRA